MKNAYPILLTPADRGYVVFIPDFNAHTEGNDIPDAIDMAQDAICLLGIDRQDDGKAIPVPTDPRNVNVVGSEILAIAVVDFEEYRRRHETKVVKKNCTIPGWLCYEAEKAQINFSQVLQEGLKERLHLKG